MTEEQIEAKENMFALSVAIDVLKNIEYSCPGIDKIIWKLYEIERKNHEIFNDQSKYDGLPAGSSYFIQKNAEDLAALRVTTNKLSWLYQQMKAANDLEEELRCYTKILTECSNLYSIKDEV